MYEWVDFIGGESGMGGHPALREFVMVCGPEYARSARPADHVGGTPARWVTAPRDAGQVARVLDVAARHELSVGVCGAGTKLDWGTPPDSVDVLIDTVRFAGVDPLPLTGAGVDGDGDGTDGDGVIGDAVTVGAGMSLRAVRAALAATGRRLALDVGSPGATVGGVLGADESGPLRLGYGTVHDLVTGLEFVTADGSVGIGEPLLGAGFGTPAASVAQAASVDRAAPVDDPASEAASLLIGACGTLGVVTRVTLRVHRLPRALAWVVRPVRHPLEIHELTSGLLASSVSPAAIEADLPAVSPGEIAVLVEGSPRVVARRARQLCRLLDGLIVDEPPRWWGRYPFSQYQIALKITAPVGDLHAGLYALRDAAGGAVSVRGSVGAGVVHAALPGGTPPERVCDVLAAVRTTLAARGGSVTLLRAPGVVRAAVESAAQSRGRMTLTPLAKIWLDPQRRFVPGRMPCHT